MAAKPESEQVEENTKIQKIRISINKNENIE
jgi:hypothetical protein